MDSGFTYGDIVIAICTLVFFCSYGLGLIKNISFSEKRGRQFTLVNVVIALGMGFAGSIFSFILLYWAFG